MQSGGCSLPWDMHGSSSDFEGEKPRDVWVTVAALSPDVFMSLREKGACKYVKNLNLTGTI